MPGILKTSWGPWGSNAGTHQVRKSCRAGTVSGRVRSRASSWPAMMRLLAGELRKLVQRVTSCWTSGGVDALHGS